MRTIRAAAMVLVTLAAATLLGTSSGLAQNARWCIELPADMGGTDCMYNTYEQCMAARSGIGGFCFRNPLYEERSRPQRRHRRRRN